MKRSRSPFERFEIQAVLWCVFLFLYIWPLLTTVGQGHPYILYIYFYVVLGIHVVVLFLLKRGLSNSASESHPESKIERR